MWVGDTAGKQPAKLPLFYQRLREMGVNTAMVSSGEGDPGPLLADHFPYYVENIVNRGLCLKWNSQVRDWDRFVTAWAKTRDEGGLVREYCLDDPQWREWARGQMRVAARRQGPHQPLAYNIRDELSVTLSANPFDYDFGPLALAGFRQWLRGRYQSLAAVNAEWGTRFADWEEVKPFTTDQIKNRLAGGRVASDARPDWSAVAAVQFNPKTARLAPDRWNFAPWADFRTYLDCSLATTLGDLRQAAQAIDPATPVGIEGTQMPSAFGGYDLARLAGVLDWVEPYDIGNAHDIFASFMPGRALLTTVFEHETAPARRRLWHLLLRGDRGCLVWWSEDCIGWDRPDYALTAKARALAPVLREMTGPLARLFLRARRLYDPVALLYSQPSIQVDWLLESCRDGSTWLRRFSSFETDHNRMVRVRDSWVKALEDLGYSPRFISSTELRQPQRSNDWRVLIMPTARALSEVDAQAIKTALATASGRTPRVVLADGTPGLFDAHGRLRPRSPLEELFPAAESAERVFAARGPSLKVASREGDLASYAADRLTAAPAFGWADWVREQLRVVPVAVRVPLAARTAVLRYAAGPAQLLAFERNITYRMSEDLTQAGGNQQLEAPRAVTARLAAPAHVYDLRAARYLGHTDQITFTLDPWQPALYALLPERVAPETVVSWLLDRLSEERAAAAARAP